MALQGTEQGAAGRIPEPDRIVMGPRCEVLAVGREFHSPDYVGMAFKGL